MEIKDDGSCDGEVGSRCSPSCENGSAQVAGIALSDYLCQEDRSWASGVPDAPLVCEKMCEGNPPNVVIPTGCKHLPRRQCIAECAAGYTRAGGAPEYTCGQSVNGSKGEWQDGSLECIVSCDPGFTPSEPVNVTQMSTNLPCAPCDVGRFSADGVECKECPGPDENKTLCLRCAEGLGPSADKTSCKTCADPLVSLAGVCGQKSLPGQIEDLWEKQSDTAKGFEVVFTMLAFALLLCCCGRAAGKERALHYVPDLIVATLALVFVMFAVFGHKSQQLADGDYEDIPWDILCSVTTALSVLPIPQIIRRYKKTVRSLGKDLDRDLGLLPENKKSLGVFGLLLFIWGLIDLFVDVSFTFSLWHCQQPVLAGCVTVSLLVTTAMAWYLGYFTLRFIVKSDIRDPSPAREWVSANSVLGPMIVVASSSRLNSMAILRLKIGGRMLVDFPDSTDNRFFHFLRSSGMFHYLVEDIPHLVISLVALYGGETDAVPVGGQHAQLAAHGPRHISTLRVGGICDQHGSGRGQQILPDHI